MIRYVYLKLQAKRMKPYLKSKLNVWSFLNPKHNFVNTNKLFFFFKKLNKISYATVGTLTSFSTKKKPITLIILIFVTLLFVINLFFI